MAATSINHASVEAITTPKGVLHRSESEGTGEHGQVCGMSVW
jgi:hypothetical protein